jgi:preprotein translocase subunit SecF
MFVVTYRLPLLIIAAVLMLGSVAIIAIFGLRLGLDFTGGSLTEVAYSVERPEKAALEERLAALGLEGFSVRESTDETGRDSYLIRTRDLSEDERVAVAEEATALGAGGEVTRFTSIGPIIGEELRYKAIWAIAGVVAVIVLYVAFAFSGIGTPVSSWTYSGITIFVLIHDVLVPTALMSLLGYFSGVEIDVLFVMAILAVLGYSVNDTIVVFDRVRENLLKFRTEKRFKRNEAGIIKEDVTYTLTRPYAEIVGESVKQTLARSINTSLTTLAALAALYFFGGAVTQTFALVLMAGVIAGTYSSIFIANPILVAYALWRNADAAAKR